MNQEKETRGKSKEKGLGPLSAFCLDVLFQCIRDQVGTYAAQTSFFFLMSIFPFMTLLFQLMMVLPISRESLLIVVNAVVPDYLLEPVHFLMQELFISRISLVWVTVLAALWSSSKAMHALTAGLDHICSARKPRGWVTERLWALLYTAIVTFALLILMTMNVFWKPLRSLLLRFRPPGIPVYLASSGIRFAVMVTAMTLIFALMYKAFPSRKLRFFRQLPGGLFSGLGWYIFSDLLSVYINRFHGFSMYGSMTAPILVMFWLYFCIYIVMIGAEINERLRLIVFEKADWAPAGKKGETNEVSDSE